METGNLLGAAPANGRRLVLFPLPFQGHINPMLQLANILHSKGFRITVVLTEHTPQNHSNYPDFTFKTIRVGPYELSKVHSTKIDIDYYMRKINETSLVPFRAYLTELMAESNKEEPVACLITDALFYLFQEIADDLKIPRMVLRTSCLSCTLIYAALPRLNISEQEHEAHVLEFPLLKIKDILKITSYPEAMGRLTTNMVKGMKASSGVIWNTFKELEETSYEDMCREIPVPHFTLGPFHKYFPASSSSLLEQDRSIISWLDAQSPKSVVYVSFGSVARISEPEFQEMAHGLANSNLPFLWAVRPGVVQGTEWIESLPENFLERVGERGRIVKWAPQQEVLAHPATGCFWTHNGWNSTLESICEGVPMICSPFVDQPINARYVCDEWKIGVLLENGLERAEIGKAIGRLMVDKEGEEIRERVNSLKEKVNLSLEKGGSSHQALENLVNYLSQM